MNGIWSEEKDVAREIGDNGFIIFLKLKWRKNILEFLLKKYNFFFYFYVYA
jgi:hypothetical protein